MNLTLPNVEYGHWIYNSILEIFHWGGVGGGVGGVNIRERG